MHDLTIRAATEADVPLILQFIRDLAEYERLADSAGIVRTFGAHHFVTSDDCWTVVGWLQRGLELCGAEGVLVTETSCCAGGAPCCEYRCEWHGRGHDEHR